MARQEHVISVFVASPSDVEAERGKLEDVIRELNTTWSRELGIRLELVRWETHAYPGCGVDAQDVINKQLPNDYDLFVGIMWCRYGTPTERAGSGTVEEFERAKGRYDKDNNSVQLMIYFKDEPIPPSQLDPAQLASINAFRASLGTEGVLYWKFSGIDHFEKLIRLHLTRQVQVWKPRALATSTREAGDGCVKRQPSEEDDEGILDLMEVFEDKFAELLEITKRIVTATDELGARITNRTDELNTLRRDAQGTANSKEAKRLIERAAVDMNQYTARLEAELPLYNSAMDQGMKSFIKAATMLVDWDNDPTNVQQRLDAVIALRVALTTSKPSIAAFRKSVASLPKMTTGLNRAKRGVIAAIDRLLAEYANSDVLLFESEKVLRDLLPETGNDR